MASHQEIVSKQAAGCPMKMLKFIKRTISAVAIRLHPVAIQVAMQSANIE